MSLALGHHVHNKNCYFVQQYSMASYREMLLSFPCVMLIDWNRCTVMVTSCVNEVLKKGYNKSVAFHLLVALFLTTSRS